MRTSRTLVALFVLLGGVMTLLILRYDPWIYAEIIQNPLVTVPLVGVIATVVGLQITHVVPVSRRAVVLNEERFDRIDPHGKLLLLPGVERIGAEIPLDEQRVLTWPVTVYDHAGAEHMVAFGLTWRLVPTGTRPESERERRVLLMTNEERRRIVVQTLESAVRDIARCMTLQDLREYLANPTHVNGLRELLCTLLDKDALTVDRLHMQRIFAAEDKYETPPTSREARTWTESRTVLEGTDVAHSELVTRTEETLRGLQSQSKPEEGSSTKPKPFRRRVRRHHWE